MVLYWCRHQYPGIGIEISLVLASLEIKTPYMRAIYIHFFSVFSITCEAMVFRITEDGILKADTLCEFTEKPRGSTRIVGDKHKVGIG